MAPSRKNSTRVRPIGLRVVLRSSLLRPPSSYEVEQAELGVRKKISRQRHKCTHGIREAAVHFHTDLQLTKGLLALKVVKLSGLALAHMHWGDGKAVSHCASLMSEEAGPEPEATTSVPRERSHEDLR
jgi:hypothetical protein